MFRKFFALFLCSCALGFSGCKSSRSIESASIIENVCVDTDGEDTVYTFFKLTDNDKPDGVSVKASSFEQACESAQKEYIPHLSLSKLELLMISEGALERVMSEDVRYISTQPFFSPVAYVALCDSGTLEKVRGDTQVQRVIEEQLILFKQNNPSVDINYLSIFNSLEQGSDEGFEVCVITYDGELRVGGRKIYLDKLKLR